MEVREVAVGTAGQTAGGKSKLFADLKNLKDGFYEKKFEQIGNRSDLRCRPNL